METEKITGHIVLVMGPMGSGKGSIIQYLHTQFPDLQYSISCTTRHPRPGETNGKEYYFISPVEFQKKVEAGEFLEWATFSGNRYGTLKSEIIGRLEAGQVVITEIELQGVQQLLEIIPKEHRTLVFIEAGDWDVLKARALARAPISEEHLALRHERYLEEIKSKPYADVVIDNREGKLQEANQTMVHLIQTIREQVHNRK